MSPPPTFRRALEMSITRAEFLRLLPAAVGAFDVDGDAMRSSGPGPAWTIRLVPLADHRLGAVAFPRHRVEIEVDAASEAAGDAFVERFRRAFLRGGG